jgi:hypothetical protein
MTTRPHSIQPPRIATWLVNLFTVTTEESIVGDLFEEFLEVVSRSGVAAAKSWYWRQTLKTVFYLFGGAFRTAPRPTIAVVLGGFFLGRVVSGLPHRLLSVVTDRYLFYWSNHFKIYMILATDGMMMMHVMSSLLVGCMVALAAKRRELVATISLALISAALITSAVIWATIHLPGQGWMAWAYADSVAFIVGGIIVRIRRTSEAASPLAD